MDVSNYNFTLYRSDFGVGVINRVADLFNTYYADLEIVKAKIINGGWGTGRLVIFRIIDRKAKVSPLMEVEYVGRYTTKRKEEKFLDVYRVDGEEMTFSNPNNGTETSTKIFDKLVERLLIII